ncbi:MAG: universal stress protein [Candidatus Hadarchaeia archaeon]
MTGKNILIPFPGTEIPAKAEDKALELLDKDGSIYLLNIVDEGPKKIVGHMTGQLSDESEIVQNFEESRKKLQEKKAKEYEENLEKKAAEHSVAVKLLFTTGDPAEEILKVIDEYSINAIVVERLRDGLTELIHGDELNYLTENAPCRVHIV